MTSRKAKEKKRKEKRKHFSHHLVTQVNEKTNDDLLTSLRANSHCLASSSTPSTPQSCDTCRWTPTPFHSSWDLGEGKNVAACKKVNRSSLVMCILEAGYRKEELLNQEERCFLPFPVFLQRGGSLWGDIALYIPDDYVFIYFSLVNGWWTRNPEERKGL